MFEVLFSRPTTIERHREGPHSIARECFLTKCVNQGYSRSMLKKFAWVLLSLAHRIDLTIGTLSKSQIDQIIDEMKISPGSRQLFAHVAVEWIRDLGCLEAVHADDGSFSHYITAFARHLTEERGLSQVTILTRCERLNWLFADLKKRNASLQTVSIIDIDAFLDAKGKNGWSRWSLASLASDIRTFFRYAEGQNWCPRNLAAAIESPHLYAQEKLHKAPNREDVEHLLAKTRGDSPGDIRDYAILLLLAYYGFRRGEVARLHLEDFDWVGEKIMISRPKQRRIQLYPLLPAVGEAILRYLQEVRPHCSLRNLFLALKAPLRPLSATSISPIVRNRLRALGIDLPSQGAHCLRHACANQLLAAGFSLKQIGDHLGHQAANSTMIYTKIDLAGLRQVADLDMRRLL